MIVRRRRAQCRKWIASAEAGKFAWIRILAAIILQSRPLPRALQYDGRMLRLPRILLLGLLVAACAPAQNPPGIDNDQVRVLTAHDEPHVKHALHEHKLNRVMVYLNAGEQDIVTQDGKKTTLKFKPGDVEWSPRAVFTLPR